MLFLDPVRAHARSLGASPMPLAYGEVAEFRRRSTFRAPGAAFVAGALITIAVVASMVLA